MRFLLSLRHAGYVPRFESTLRLLCERGNEVVVALGIPQHSKASASERLLEELEADHEGLQVVAGVEPRSGREPDLGAALRNWRDYLRFVEPPLAEASRIRARSARDAPGELVAALEATSDLPDFRRALGALIRIADESVPVENEIVGFVESQAPDAVLVSPLVERWTPQVSYLRAGRALGLPTGLCVAGWDNLTTTTLIHGDPDVVTVWNGAQREEAIFLHGIPDPQVSVTGAPVYDAWFEQGPTLDRQEFCARAGLPDDRPYILYVCSSNFIAPKERAWIMGWIKGMRETGVPELEEAAVLVRPHPFNAAGGARRLTSLDRVAVYPDAGEEVASAQSLADEYDSMYHAAAVVGINTSAMIEAATVGRGVYVLLAKRYRGSQTDSPHFQHLRTEGGGLIQATSSLEEHTTQLERAVRGEDRDEASRLAEAFLGQFIRPFGLDQPATPLLAAALEELAARPRVEPPPGPGPSERVLAAAQSDLATLARLPRARVAG